MRKVRRGELWNGEPERRNRNDVPRRVIVETLILAGLRVSELCGLDGPHVDLAAARLRVPRSATKSDAGERNVPIVPALREAADRAPRALPERSRPSRPSRRETAPARTRTTSARGSSRRSATGRTEQLEAEGRLPIAHMTPHTLRRTFASILAVCDVPPRRAMYLMGHTDPTLTLAVYQQVLDMGKGSVELLEQTLGCTLAEARADLQRRGDGGRDSRSEPPTGPRSGLRGRSRSNEPVATNGRAASRVSGTNPEPSARRRARRRSRTAHSGNKKPRLSGAFLRAAEGTRTLDLLHGKQTL